MKPRARGHIMSLPVSERLPVIAQGLALLAEHAERLRDDAEQLIASKRNRGAVIIDHLAQEEAAKVLILLHLVRMGWRDDKAAMRQLKGLFGSERGCCC